MAHLIGGFMNNIDVFTKEYYIHLNTIKDTLAYISEEIRHGRDREAALQYAVRFYELEPIDIEYIVGIIENKSSK